MRGEDPGYRRFSLVAGSLLAAFSASLFALAAYVEPLTGNLTRMGGYLENEFGWNAPQQVFAEPLFEIATRIEDYDRRFDVIVVGDSFSQNRASGWQNFFVNETGLDLLTFHVARVEIDEILASPVFRAEPPRFFIYESIERNLLSRHPTCDRKRSVAPARDVSGALPPFVARPRQVEAVRVDRSERPPFPGSSRLDTAINYARKAMLRRVLGFDRTEVRRHELSRSDLFSSRRSGELLILTRDDKLRGASPARVDAVGCSLVELQDRVESNGRTRFVALLFPDKSTAYGRYIVDEAYEPMSILSRVEGHERLRSARLGETIPGAIAEGGLDVYLPDDEHCGSLGYAIAARSLVDVLAEAGAIVRPRAGAPSRVR